MIRQILLCAAALGAVSRAVAAASRAMGEVSVARYFRRSPRPRWRPWSATCDLTMGENIADSGGLNPALDAYHASLHGRTAPVIDGLTGDQRVFLG